MRVRACLLILCVVAAAAAPAGASERPPRPIVKSHGVKVKAAHVDQCPRGDRYCGLGGDFVGTEPVPVHAGGLLRIDTRRRVRRLQLELDCPRRRVKVVEQTRWTFELPENGCARGDLTVTYRRTVVRYGFNVERHAHTPCEADESEIVVANGFVRVYSRKGVDYLGEPETVFYACRFDSGKSLRIGTRGCGDAYSPCSYVEQVRLAGKQVAYVAGQHPDRYGRWNFTLSVLDTESWSVEPRFSESAGSPTGPNSGYTRVTDVALKDNGSIAWITHRRDFTGAPPTYYAETYEVRKTDASGSNTLVDSDPAVDEESLELSGSTLTWSVNGEPRSATLD